MNQKQDIFVISKIKKQLLWSKKEDDMIRSLINTKSKCKWNLISSKLKNKSPSQIYLRSKLIDPNLKKGKFSKEEDENLKRLVSTFGPSWSFLSRVIKKRNAKQLRLRYNNYLNEKLCHTKFTKKEDQKILILYTTYGQKWSKYLKHFPNRSYIRIKDRYFSLLKMNEKKYRKEKTVNTKLNNDHKMIQNTKIKVNLMIDFRFNLKEISKIRKSATQSINNSETNFFSNDISNNHNENFFL